MVEANHVTRGPSKISGGGYGVFASKDFAPGEVVISIPRPLVAELETARLADTCSWCFSHQYTALSAPDVETLEIKACTGCRKIKYCSRSCQSKHWKLDHKHECKALSDPQRPPLPHGVRATIKLLKRLELGDEAVRSILSFQPKIEHLQENDPQILEDAALMAVGAWKYAGEPKGTNLDTSKALFLNVMCNTLDLSSALANITLGIGFDPLLCSINHSCEPNAMLILNNPQATIRATKNIAQGEEIFIHYRDPSNPFTVRQAELKEKYFFACKCRKCEKGNTLREDLFLKNHESLGPEWDLRAEELIQKHVLAGLDVSKYRVGGLDEDRKMTAIQTEAFRLSGMHGSSVMDTEAALRFCFESGIWPLARQPVPYLLRSLFESHIAEGPDAVDKALHVGLVRQFIVSPILTPQPFDNGQIIDTVTLAQVAIAWQRSQGGSSVMRLSSKGCDVNSLIYGLLCEAWDAVPLSYGRNSQFGRAVDMLCSSYIPDDKELVLFQRQKVKLAWPTIRAYAETINILEYL